MSAPPHRCKTTTCQRFVKAGASCCELCEPLEAARGQWAHRRIFRANEVLPRRLAVELDRLRSGGGEPPARRAQPILHLRGGSW